MTDFLVADNISKIINSQLRPRLLYKNGITAEGVYISYIDISNYTNCKIFCGPSYEIPIRVRFSKVFGEKGASDTRRDITGMSVRFYTDEGTFDIIGHSIRLNENLKNAEAILHLIGLLTKSDAELSNPGFLWCEALKEPKLVPFLIDYYSDASTVKSFRGITGYSLNDYVLVSNKGEKREVSFKWVSENDIKCIGKSEAEFLAGFEPDIAKRELIRAIRERAYPKFNLLIRFSDGEDLIAGQLVLKEISSGYVNEEISFTPSNTVTGIELKDNEFNGFTAFAFNESIRFREVRGDEL